ncbi:MAG: beta-propeller fold lactonase family protein [Gemmatimonadaceae bacterium]|nr:beta-propeller fold lactonase family protein [Gemmatimonadaceae bacterium]MDQ3520481.1 lactonase family protein [Gemmatimonadota bacterium]
MQSKQYLIMLASVMIAAGCSADRNITDPLQRTGAVYIQTNDGTNNQIIAYRRAANGELLFLDSVSTGGRGTGRPRLGSQGPVILTQDERWLLVTNAGSNDISVLSASPSGGSLVQTVSSGGTAPYSIAVRGNLVYVMNEGSAPAAAPANISAFRLGTDGRLTAIAGSTRPLSTAFPEPGQVSFSPDGASLVVTEKATSKIDTYALQSDGTATGPTVFTSNGQTPFGFAFRNDGVFVMTEAQEGTAGLASASSYSLAGGFHSISASVRNGETDVCWAVIAGGGQYAYITNFGSGTISSYSIATGGSITLLEAVAGRTAAAQGPRDLDLDRSGDFLYVLDVGFADASTRAVHAFAVQDNGRLARVGTFAVPGNHPNVAGLAAF